MLYLGAGFVDQDSDPVDVDFDQGYNLQNISEGGTAIQHITIRRDNVSNSGADGLYAENVMRARNTNCGGSENCVPSPAVYTAEQTIIVEDSVFTLNVDDGLQFRNEIDDDDGGAALGNIASVVQDITISGTTVTMNGQDGLDFDNAFIDDGAEVMQTVDLTGGNTVTGNVSQGADIDNDDGNQTVDLTGSDFSGNGAGPFDADNDGGTQTVTGP